MMNDFLHKNMIKSKLQDVGVRNLKKFVSVFIGVDVCGGLINVFETYAIKSIKMNGGTTYLLETLLCFWVRAKCI